LLQSAAAADAGDNGDRDVVVMDAAVDAVIVSRATNRNLPVTAPDCSHSITPYGRHPK